MTTALLSATRVKATVTAAALGACLIAWTPMARAGLPTQGYADLVEKVSPAVVFISSTQKMPTASEQMQGNRGRQFNFPPGSPFEDFFKHFFEQIPQQHRGPVTALGSGFIINPEGDIVTNNHVVDGASKIDVKLPDGREFTAKVVGVDKKTDLALIHIKADKALPYVSFGNSDNMRRGDVVLAVGNPFGLGGTVTAGIISAHHRNINAGPYDNFIQTDASINRGNSGGPLFNTDGKVIGVNTAIYSPSGGSVGIGFAIPSNLTKQIVSQLRAHGKVERGWLGVKIQQVSPEIAQAMGMDKPHGALVAEVTPKSPAARAGLRQGDVIIGYNGKRLDKMRELPTMVANTKIGKTVNVEVLRNGEEKDLSVSIAKLDEEQVASLSSGEEGAGGIASHKLGVSLATLDNDTRAQLNLDEDATGVVVTNVDPNGHAASAGLRPGDVIVKVGARTVHTPSDVAKAVSEAKGKAVLLMVNRKGDTFFVGVRISDA